MYLLGSTHMQRNLMVKNLGLCSYHKGKASERDPRLRHKRHLGPLCPDQVIVNSLWDVEVQPLSSIKCILIVAKLHPGTSHFLSMKNQGTELKSLNALYDLTSSMSIRNYTCPRKSDVSDHSKKV